MECPRGPHECRKVWDCGHGRQFPKHEADGQGRCSTDGPGACPECQEECEGAMEQVGKVRVRMYGLAARR
jgi:hypothetical protein